MLFNKYDAFSTWIHLPFLAKMIHFLHCNVALVFFKPTARGELQAEAVPEVRKKTRKEEAEGPNILLPENPDGCVGWTIDLKYLPKFTERHINETLTEHSVTMPDNIPPKAEINKIHGYKLRKDM